MTIDTLTTIEVKQLEFYLIIFILPKIKMQCDFEKSCAKFAIVFSMIVPTLIGLGLLITIIVMAVQKKPKNDYLFFVYYLIGLIIVSGAAFLLYNRFPGIFCGFFLIYLLSLFLQPIVNFAVFK